MKVPAAIGFTIMSFLLATSAFAQDRPKITSVSHLSVYTSDAAKTEALLDDLWSYATRDEIAWKNQWQPGDVVLWDNRCTMHRRDAFDPHTRRVLYRTQIKSA